VGELRVQIPNELHKKLKQLALDKGVTLKKLIADILGEYVTDTSKREEKG
jgi:predicted HicB family RNase H-like nuclease